jgi:hypothetical protein
MHGKEISRFNGAVRFMSLHCSRRCGLWWATTEKSTARTAIADIQKRITKLQGAHNLPPYNATVFETLGGQHAHIVFIGDPDLVQHLKSSATFGGIIEVEPVTDPNGLTRKYLAKERTSQAGYKRTDLGGRISGSHHLEGGGDRVRLSRDLERDAIEAEYVWPWVHTNAKRIDQRKLSRLKNTGPYARAPLPAGQILLPFPELSKPVARLQAFGGGYIPKAVALEIEHRRKDRGLSQRQLAALAGRSQGQLANALRGHDPISAPVVNRLRDALITAR